MAGLEARLADPDTYRADPAGEEAARLSGELEQARSAVERLMSRWAELETKREAGDS